MFTKTRIILILGLWIAIAQYLGFPSSYESFFISVSGLLVALLAFLHARDRRRMKKSFSDTEPRSEVRTNVYAENGPMWKSEENLGQ